MRIQLNKNPTRIVTATNLVAVYNETQDTRYKTQDNKATTRSKNREDRKVDKNGEERSGRWASHSVTPAGHEVTAEEPAGQ